MKSLVITISICLSFLLLGVGCSKEEQPPPQVQKPRVVKPIVKPAPEKIKTSITGEEEMSKTEEQEEIEVKTAAVEEIIAEAPETTETGTTGKKTSEVRVKKVVIEEKAAETPEPPETTETGYYIVKKDDSLSSISGREDVYGDPAKWPIVYRLNMDNLGNLGLGENFPDRELSEGVRLKIITPDEARENLKKRANDLWVVNIISATTKGEVIPPAIRLIKDGYKVYFTKVKVKGNEWMRLRVGFFKNKTEADAEGQEIMAMLNFSDSWTTKIGKREFAEFGGYYPD